MKKQIEIQSSNWHKIYKKITWKTEFNQPGFLLTSFHQDIIWYSGKTSLVDAKLIRTSYTLILQSIASKYFARTSTIFREIIIQFIIEKIRTLGFSSAFKPFVTTELIFLATKHESKLDSEGSKAWFRRVEGWIQLETPHKLWLLRAIGKSSKWWHIKCLISLHFCLMSIKIRQQKFSTIIKSQKKKKNCWNFS